MAVRLHPLSAVADCPNLYPLVARLHPLAGQLRLWTAGHPAEPDWLELHRMLSQPHLSAAIAYLSVAPR